MKRAGDRPDDSSRSREYRCVKKMWKTRSSESGPKYMKVEKSRQYYEISMLVDCRLVINVVSRLTCPLLKTTRTL